MTGIQAYSAENPAHESDLAGVLTTVLSKFLQGVDDCLPAQVIAYDRAANVATVRPLVAVVSTEGDVIPRARIARVPVFAFGCGRYVLNFPLKAGDLGWIKANDRDISLYLQALREARPNTRRKHSFEDGVFFPDAMRTFTVNDEDAEANAVLQTSDGGVRVALWPDRVKVTANDTWFSVGSDGAITARAPQKIRFDTPLVEFTGVFTTGTGSGDGGDAGMSVINGGLRTSRDVVSGTVSVQHHVHGGVQSGGSTTAEPVK